MTLNLIFPMNNKGGVGKTSILTDLCSALAQRHRVGILDFDDQASLASTLLGIRKPDEYDEIEEDEMQGEEDKLDFVCRDLEDYDLAVHNVVLNPAREFAYSDILSRLDIRVAPTRAHVCVFPAGITYEHPEKRTELETIVRERMKMPTFVAADLPPIPHPGMILDYTIQPLVDAFSGDVRLFPIIIATPDHNVIDIALRGYAKIARYFQEKGVPKERVHPLFVLNKVPLQEREGKVTTQFDESIERKLGELGIIYVSKETRSGINRIKHSFDYQGVRYRSVVFPRFEDIREGCFSLMFNQELSLAQYPHLVDMVKAHKYPGVEETDPRRRVFMYSLREAVNFITAKSEEKPTKNYTKKREVYDLKRMESETARELQEFIETYYRTGKLDYTENVAKWQWGCSSAGEWFGIPKTMSKEGMIEIIYRTCRELHPSSETTKEEIGKAFEKETEYDDGTFNIYDRTGEEMIEIEYKTIDPVRIRLGIPDKDEKRIGGDKIDPNVILPQINIFLRNFGQYQGK